MGGSDAISVLGYESMTFWSYSMVMRNSDSTTINSVAACNQYARSHLIAAKFLTVYGKW